MEESQMMFTEEMLRKAKTAASAEELLEMAKAEGIEFSADEAARYYSLLHGSLELSDDDLEQIAGGKGEKPTPQPKYRNGLTVERDWHTHISKGTITGTDHYSPSAGWVYNVHYYQSIDIWREKTEISYDSWEGLEMANDDIKVYE